MCFVISIVLLRVSHLIKISIASESDEIVGWQLGNKVSIANQMIIHINSIPTQCESIKKREKKVFHISNGKRQFFFCVRLANMVTKSKHCLSISFIRLLLTQNHQCIKCASRTRHTRIVGHNNDIHIHTVFADFFFGYPSNSNLRVC